MAMDRPGERGSRLGPEAVARTAFATSFRGFDPDQVRAFLEQVANELREARDREAALRAEIDDMARKVDEMGQLDEARVTEMLGAETAKILTTARSAATEITNKADESAERILREANEQSGRLRDDADRVLADRTAAAETAGAARSEADAQCEEELEVARERGREMVNEAMAVRARVLGDLARKRRVAREQVVRLQAGRERLIESYAVVRRTLDETTDELRDSLIEAKVAADAAARREAEADDGSDDLEQELMAVAPAPNDAPPTDAPPEPGVEPAPIGAIATPSSEEDVAAVPE